MDGRPLCPTDSPDLSQWAFVLDYSHRLTGFQTQSPNNLYPSKGLSCPGVSDEQVLEQVVKNAVRLSADFLEIYESDALDPAKGQAVREAHDRLAK